MENQKNGLYKFLKWVLIIGGIILFFYLISNS
jgi:hypothetical protein